jgi:hypothetical protein
MQIVCDGQAPESALLDNAVVFARRRQRHRQALVALFKTLNFPFKLLKYLINSHQSSPLSWPRLERPAHAFAVPSADHAVAVLVGI